MCWGADPHLLESKSHVNGLSLASLVSDSFFHAEVKRQGSGMRRSSVNQSPAPGEGEEPAGLKGTGELLSLSLKKYSM